MKKPRKTPKLSTATKVKRTAKKIIKRK